MALKDTLVTEEALQQVLGSILPNEVSHGKYILYYPTNGVAV
jgi:hypothetical protein